MKYKQQKQYRLKGFDYSQTGYYFVTMCTKDRMCCFGDIVDGEMRLSEIGRVAKDELLRTAKIRSNIILDDHVVMPNHVHAILIIMDGRNAPRRVPTEPGMQPLDKGSLSSIVNHYKGAVTRACNMHGLDFKWQARFHDHIIRNDRTLERIREYIRTNIIRWEVDELHR